MTKTWQERFRLKLWNVYATIFQSSLYDDKQLKEKEDVMVEFITDLRKGDMEALIEMLPDFLDECSNNNNIKNLIKDYYER